MFLHKPEINLESRVAVITGGSRGIGAAAALALARAGAAVVINYLNHEQEANEVARQASASGAKAVAVRADVASLDEVQRLFAFCDSEFGRVDVLVANAGVWTGSPIEEMEERMWRETIDINLTGVWSCCRHAAPMMKRQRSGRIITVSSTAAQRGEAFHSHYAASKGGIVSLTKSLAGELGPWGITVNSVAPGWVDTDMSAEPLHDKTRVDEILRGIPLGRVATSEDVAGSILFLASDFARHITGEVINVNGGSVMCG